MQALVVSNWLVAAKHDSNKVSAKTCDFLPATLLVWSTSKLMELVAGQLIGQKNHDNVKLASAIFRSGSATFHFHHCQPKTIIRTI